jgi:hypothetical protein
MEEGTEKYTWKHIDSVLKELGEIGTNLQAERAKRNQLILKIKNESDMVVKALERREATLFQVLQEFAETYGLPEALSIRKFRHGQIRIDDGNVAVVLTKGGTTGK